MPRLRNAGLNRKLQSTSVPLKTRHAQQSHGRPSPLLLCGVAPGTGILGMKSPTDSVMVNFMSQLAWAMGHPVIWSNIILGVSVSVAWGEINI